MGGCRPGGVVEERQWSARQDHRASSAGAPSTPTLAAPTSSSPTSGFNFGFSMFRPSSCGGAPPTPAAACKSSSGASSVAGPKAASRTKATPVGAGAGHSGSTGGRGRPKQSVLDRVQELVTRFESAEPDDVRLFGAERKAQDRKRSLPLSDRVSVSVCLLACQSLCLLDCV